MSEIKVYKCKKCGWVGLMDSGWECGRHSNECDGYTAFVGWLSHQNISVLDSPCGLARSCDFDGICIHAGKPPNFCQASNQLSTLDA